MNSAIIVVTGLIALLSSLSIVDGQYKRVDDMTDEELKNWIKPPNKQYVQRMIIERMLMVMDSRYNPCDDFYKFSCGNYEKIAPADYGTPCPFIEAEEQILRIVTLMLLNSGRGYSTSRVERIVNDFFKSCMYGQTQVPSVDEVMESFGSWPAFDSYWRERDFDWMETFVDTIHYDVDTFISGGLGYGDNGRNQFDSLSLYLNISEAKNAPAEPLEFYVNLYQDMFANSRVPLLYIEGMAQRLQLFNSQVYEIKTNALRSYQYNIGQVVGDRIYTVQDRVPSCDLGRLVALISGQEVDTSKSVAVPSVQYLEDICRLLQNTDKQTVADYFFVSLYTKVASDIEEYKALTTSVITSTCVTNTRKLAGPLLGKMYIDEYLTPEVTQDLANLTDSLQDLAVEMFRTQSSWMDERTRHRAMKKMEGAIKVTVGPKYMLSEKTLLKQYEDVHIDPTNYILNVKQLRRRKNLNAYGTHGKSREYYEIDPLEVGLAFSSAGRGFMLIQAVIYQLPLFHPYAPSFYKFGAILAAIGHEFMHGFDVTNIIFDENGKPQQWISPNLELTYAFNSECFHSQFEKYHLGKTDIHVGGALTLGENVADNDGLKIAFNLYKKWLAENPEIVRQEEIDYAPLQLTHEQLFWLTYGQMWCDTRSMDQLIEQFLTDEHSPNMFRVIGGVSNSHDFARVYQCQPHMKMNPSEKCHYMFD